jgi:G3E family GTPase
MLPQVAKTFTMELEDGSVFEDGSAAELASVARLDTCVTLADAGNLMANFGSLQSLAQREPGRVDEADDRNVADLLLDQIEFADVILLNKARILVLASCAAPAVCCRT